ncbi:MAG: 6,7-dimethyl-8-ribityllumazine synthase, partial [Pseudomonadota bacterium]
MARTIEGLMTPPQGRFALCVTRWNAFITEELLKGALDALRRHGVPEDAVDVIWVPGAFELPGVVRRA